MTPLEATPNRDIGNLGYASKQAIYAASGFQMTQKIAEHYPDWTEAVIDSRQQKMAKVASQIWRIDFNQGSA